MKNWKTTLIGVGAGIAYILSKVLSHTFDAATDISIAAGMAGLGIVAKDHNVTGGSTQQ